MLLEDEEEIDSHANQVVYFYLVNKLAKMMLVLQKAYNQQNLKVFKYQIVQATSFEVFKEE